MTSNSGDNPYLRSSELLSRHASKLLIVDVQEKLTPAIPNVGRMISNCRRLIEGAKILGVPTFATEQYPKGLGATVPELASLLTDRPAKVRFSCVECLGWGFAAEQTDDRHQVVVAGMEAHVCVLQTVLDLLAHGYRVFVPADAVASRNDFDWDVALQRMSSCGATITTTESVLFEWCEVAGTPEFKQISELVKNAK
jgi:nicotinamidase-related amidase